MKKRYSLIIFLLFLQGIAAQVKTTVFDVARSGKAADIEALYKADKAIINATDANGFTPLILACYRSNAEVVNFLVKQKCDINYVSQEGTALMATAVKGNVELSKLLLLNGANPNLTNYNGTTALMFAAQFKHAEIVKLLLANKADKSVQNKEGKTAFEYAVFTNDETIINLLK